MAIIAGVVLVLLAVGLLGTGGVALWADRTQRDESGFLTTNPHRYQTGSYALTVEGVNFGGRGVHWVYPRSVLDRIRIRVAPLQGQRPLFVGIGPAADVARYLAGVRRAEIEDFGDTNVRSTTAGHPPSGPPADQAFWDVTSSGGGVRILTWPVRGGRWSVVVMNEGGGAGLDVEASIGARVPALLWIAVGLLVAGLVFAALGGLLLWFGVRTPRGDIGGPVPPPPPPGSPPA